MSVRDFGAKGDGATDDTQALQHALEQTGSLQLHRGTYRITRPLEVDLRLCGPLVVQGDGSARIVMAGPGPAIRVTGGHTGSADPRTVTETTWAKERMPILEGFEIVGAHPEADGVELVGTMQATLTRLLIRECRCAIRVAKRNRNVLIADCHLYHNRSIGVYLDAVNLHQINIHGCHISYNARGGIVVRESEIRNLQIVGNDIEYNYDPASKDSADVWIETGESSVREVAISGNTIQAIPSPGGANIRIVGRGPDVRHKAGLISITGNHLGSQEVNLHFRWARGVVVDGNTFQVATISSIHAEESEGVLVGANTFDFNPDYPSARLGVRLRRCRASRLAGFLMRACQAGTPESGACVELAECEDVDLQGIQIMDPQFRGIELRDSTACTVTGCHIRDTRSQPAMREAIRVLGGQKNWVSGNYFGPSMGPAVQIGAGAGTAEHNHSI